MTTAERTIRLLVAAYRHLPAKPFRGFLNTLLLRHIRSRPPRTVLAEIGGIRYKLDLQELIDANLYYRGSHEPRAMASVAEIVRPGDLVLDIGANAGYYALPLARLVGDAGRVIAFEPTPWALSKLEENLRLNDMTNVYVERLAISDERAIRAITAGEAAFRASWRLDGSTNRSLTGDASFMTLDEYADEHRLPRIAFAKVDVDGYELRVIRGAQRTLARHRPSLLLEIGKYTMAELGDDPLDLARMLAELGYLFASDDGGRLYGSAEELVASIAWDEPVTVLCRPQEGAGA